MRSLEDQPYILEEYKALRNEIVKRIELRYQTVHLILIVAGIFLSLGVEQRSAPLLLLYPLVSLFLLTLWIHNGNTLMIIGKYISEQIERDTTLGWETFVRESYPEAPAFGYLNTLGIGGLITITQILAFVLALLNLNGTWVERVLIGVSSGAILLTGYMLIRNARKKRL